MTVSSSRTKLSTSAFRRALEDSLYFTRGATIRTASLRDAYAAICYTVRDHLVARWRATTETYLEHNPRFVYWLSAEYMPGKQLEQNMLYTGVEAFARHALAKYRLELDDFFELDVEPGLGNGGLGRLAACLLDSLATLEIPAVGYGIRYEFGIFSQAFEDGAQVESPDDWLSFGYSFEFPQPDNRVEVGFRGHTERCTDANGREHVRWVPAQQVFGEPHTHLVPGYGTRTVNLLRLWRARATQGFDFRLFDEGDYARAVAQKIDSENLTKVLYPNDNTPQGKELRLQQQYFFVACSLRDILRRFRLLNDAWTALPDKVVIHLNDTHPVLAIPELMRLLVDQHELTWEVAWELTGRTFAYTCHTLLPEALECWPVELFRRLLPRHLEIVFEINRRFLEQVRMRWPGDEARVGRMSLIEETNGRNIRMAHLAVVGSFSTNGVADLHSRLLHDRTLRDFAEMWPERFSNKTNGVSLRRFVRLANPGLADLITQRIGAGWLRDAELLRELEPAADDAAFRSAWRQVKRANKERLAGIARDRIGVALDPDSIFDVLVKRLHEYKRQLLKALHVITLYHRAKRGVAVAPYTFVFGAKAAPGYHTAKLIIKLINALGTVVNRDSEVNGRLRVAFLPNFNVSLAERIYPAADVSEQISTAGMEASGTGNMKLALNGAVTIGTLDGANIEIRDRVGHENFFLFGLTVEELEVLRARGYDPRRTYEADPELRAALDELVGGRLGHGDRELFRPLFDSLLTHDPYFVLADYGSYVRTHDRLAAAFADTEAWTRMSIRNVARSGWFSIDRAATEYCRDIWKVAALPVR